MGHDVTERLAKVPGPRLYLATSIAGLRRQRRCPLAALPNTREVVVFVR